MSARTEKERPSTNVHKQEGSVSKDKRKRVVSGPLTKRACAHCKKNKR